MNPILLVILLLGLTFTSLHAKMTQIKSFDNFKITIQVDLPASKKADNFIILVHGSGPQSMDLDISSVSHKESQPNKVFLELSKILTLEGFGVVRFHKRSFVMKKLTQKDPNYAKSKYYQKFIENPLNYFIRDVQSLIKYTKNHLKAKRIILFGNSQGTYVSLQAAHENPHVDGLVLVGTQSASLAILSFEQLVYRAMKVFWDRDKNQDNFLDQEELSDKRNAITMNLKSQLALLDLNQDQKLDLMEYKGANYLNYMTQMEPQLKSLIKEEFNRPRPIDILAKTKLKVLFLQGSWDNQTPAYYTKSIELMNKLYFKKSHFHFIYYPQLGHILDQRNSYYDIYYRQLAPHVAKKIGPDIKRYILGK